MKQKTLGIKCRGVIIHDGSLLAVKHGTKESPCALPGGHLEYGEGPIECVEREIIEELGIKPIIGRLLYVNTYIEGEGVQQIEFFFEIKNASDYLSYMDKVRTHANELAEIAWIKPDFIGTLLPKAFEDDFRNNLIGKESPAFISE